MARRLDGKVALITGGAGGLGFAYARRFVAEGARVVIADVADVVAALKRLDAGEAAHGVRADVAVSGDCRRMVVLNRAGEWVAVAPVADSFVINLGDLMMHWTNDRWISTLHRVVNPPRDAALGSRRQSIVSSTSPTTTPSSSAFPAAAAPPTPPSTRPSPRASTACRSSSERWLPLSRAARA